jgi:HSP20 family protein
MALIRWSPFAELDAVERRMRRMLTEFGPSPAWPAADVYESNGEYIYEVEVPGYEEKELAVEVRDHTLTIKGERAETKEAKERTFFLNERLATNFERRFELPQEANTGKVAAEFKKGVLFVHAPKTAKAEPRPVAITAAS